MVSKSLVLRVFVMLFVISLAASSAVVFGETAGLDETAGMEFAAVKGGCFQMGDSVGDGDPNERPVHEVCVSDFLWVSMKLQISSSRNSVPATTAVNLKASV